jgi:hypothetical protein
MTKFFYKFLLINLFFCLSIQPLQADNSLKYYKKYLNQKFKLNKISLKIDLIELNQQISHNSSSYPNGVGFKKSLEKSIITILNFKNDWEAPLAMILEDACFELFNHQYDLCFKNDEPVESVKTYAVKKLKEFLNQKSSTLSLLKLGERPEHGEKVEQNWIFQLKMNTYSDHIYWIIIDRSGKKEPFLYGFN